MSECRCWRVWVTVVFVALTGCDVKLGRPGSWLRRQAEQEQKEILTPRGRYKRAYLMYKATNEGLAQSLGLHGMTVNLAEAKKNIERVRAHLHVLMSFLPPRDAEQIQIRLDEYEDLAMMLDEPGNKTWMISRIQKMERQIERRYHFSIAAIRPPKEEDLKDELDG